MLRRTVLHGTVPAVLLARARHWYARRFRNILLSAEMFVGGVGGVFFV